MENKKYVKIVNGKEYNINPKKYYETFKETHNECKKCDICDGKYNYYTKKTHMNSKKHLASDKIKTEMNILLEQIKNL